MVTLSRFFPHSSGVLCKAARATTVLLLPIFMLSPAFAGDFTVSPVRLYMTPRDRAIAVTITNQANETLVMQADLYQWKQTPDGEDNLTLTEDIFLSPPIIKLGPNAKQVVRLARVKPRPTNEELTYRLILREVPEAKSSRTDLQVQLALAFSLPVFITPPRLKPVLACAGERVSESTVKAVCENTGNAHALLTTLSLDDEKGQQVASRDSGGYILPGIKRSFELKRAEGAIPNGKGKLSITLVDGSKQAFDIVVTGPQGPAQ